MRSFAIVCLLALLAACAPKAKTSNQDVFTTIDTNNDGKLSMEEVLKASKHPNKDAVRSRFEMMDSTTDGYLDRQEFDVWRGLDDDTSRMF